MRTTPDNITELLPNDVFVFGSNEAGRHGAGAAKLAMRWGAKYGHGFGMAGQTFAIPSLDKDLRQLRLHEIDGYVIAFADNARLIPHLTYRVTEIGCGLAGFTPEQIAPLFAPCKDIPNVHLPARFWAVINSMGT